MALSDRMHEDSRWCVLASGRRGGRRSAGHARHFPSVWVLRVCIAFAVLYDQLVRDGS